MYRPVSVFLVILILLACGGQAAMTADRKHPHLYLTSQDIQRAQENIKRFPWAMTYFDEVKARSDEWLNRSDEEIRELLPAPASLFAYGFAGCPSCKVGWPLWGVGGICSFDKPGKVTCPNCKRVFPDAEHPDDGQGWYDTASGRHYYFVAIYNSYVAQTLTLTSLDDLSTVYAITGDERYAHKAAIIFDAIAKIYPTCTVGSIDYPRHPGGRFERTEYQVARVLVFFARYYDLLFNSPALDKPSQAGEPTIRKSIEDRILKDGAKWCYDHGNSGRYGLTNGEADYVRGVMCVGLVLGIQDYIDWSVSGPYSIMNHIENNIHHDGQYYETSNMYSQHAIGLYRDMAEMLINYSSDKYPQGINLYEHPKFSKALVQAELDTICAGHVPRYGDSSPDVQKVQGTANDVRIAYMNAEHIYLRSTTPEAKTKWAAMLNKLSKGDVEGMRSSPASFKNWLLYHAEPVSVTEKSLGDIEPDESFLLDGKGLAVLRSGTGPAGRVAFVRYGPSVTHGHRDDLNLNFFALGRELTYDFGYSLGSAHVQTGWAHQTGSHNLVMVNEKTQLEAGPTGGSAELFAVNNCMQMAELSSDNAYKAERVNLYRRTLALIDTDPQHSYLVDIFRVNGGQTHDLLWHALGDEVKVEGSDLGDVQPGSLATPDYEWGSKVGTDGDINGQAEKGPYWVAPPGNGYGFLYNVRRGAASGPLSATWTVDPEAGDKLRVDMLPPKDCEVITAEGPGILQKLPHAKFTILRRKGQALQSTFVSILQPFNENNSVKHTEQLEKNGDADTATAVRVVLTDGRTDYIFSDLSVNAVTDFNDGSNFQGRYAFARFGLYGLESAALVGAKHLSVNDVQIDVAQSSYWGRIKSVDHEKCTILVNRLLPVDGSLVGKGVYINNPAYDHSSYYKIKSVTRKSGGSLILLDSGTLVLGSGYVSKSAEPGARDIDNLVPLEMCRSCRGLDTGYFNGKLLISDDGTKANINNVKAADGKRIIQVGDASQFKSESRLQIFDIQSGDVFSIPCTVFVNSRNGEINIASDMPGTLKIGKREWRFGGSKDRE